MDGDICAANASRGFAREIAFSVSEAPATESKVHGRTFEGNKKPGRSRVFLFYEENIIVLQQAMLEHGHVL